MVCPQEQSPASASASRARIWKNSVLAICSRSTKAILTPRLTVRSTAEKRGALSRLFSSPATLRTLLPGSRLGLNPTKGKRLEKGTMPFRFSFSRIFFREVAWRLFDALEEKRWLNSLRSLAFTRVGNHVTPPCRFIVAPLPRKCKSLSVPNPVYFINEEYSLCNAINQIVNKKNQCFFRDKRR